MKLIFAVLDVSLSMGLTCCYKTEGFYIVSLSRSSTALFVTTVNEGIMHAPERQNKNKNLVLAKINTKLQNPGFFAFYDIRPADGVGLLFWPQSPPQGHQLSSVILIIPLLMIIIMMTIILAMVMIFCSNILSAVVQHFLILLHTIFLVGDHRD